MGKKKTPAPNTTDIYNRSVEAYNSSKTPSPLEGEMGGVSQNFMNLANQASQRNMADYGNIMSGYQGLKIPGPTNFSFQNVKAQRPNELNESYGYLREAMPGYREFASTGGYSPTDIQELRARSTNPVRSAYGNTMRELDRSRTLGGNGGASNYIAARSRAQRELPGQLADAMTGINAQLADQIRQGKMFGLQGITGTGSTMGNLSSAEAGRMLQADLANQGADLQAQQLSEQSLQNNFGNQLQRLGGQASLYGTTPGMSSVFGNQALSAYNSRLGAEQARMGQGLEALNSQIRTSQGPQQGGTPWWKTALGVAGTVAPYVAMMSSRTVKHDIKKVKGKELSKFAKALKDLDLYTWKYNGEDTKHFGPIAEEFKQKLGVGDGKTIHPTDVMGVVMAAAKENLANA